MKKTENKRNGVYGVIGMIALFLIGCVVGFIVNGTTRVNDSLMTKKQCNELAEHILGVSYQNQPELLEQLNKVFSENCNDRNLVEQKSESKVLIENEPLATCKAIENHLIHKLICNDENHPCMNEQHHIYDAQIYANLAERGCAENSAKFKELAKQELEVARALTDDNLVNKDESIEIVETYKRLQMQAEAEKMIEKAKKLTNPAIDFIIELEKIIEE